MSPLSGSKRSVIAIALIFWSGGSLLFAQEQSATTISEHVKEIFERAAKAVVKIHGVDEHSEICGTGFFIDPTGTLYTACTACVGASNFSGELGANQYSAQALAAILNATSAILQV